MSAIFDPMNHPVNNHSTKADPAAARSLREEFFKLQTCHNDSYRIADLASVRPSRCSRR